jgi:nitrogen regulatory protein PII
VIDVVTSLGHVVMKIHKVKGEGRQSQINFVLILYNHNAQHASAEIQKATIRRN